MSDPDSREMIYQGCVNLSFIALNRAAQATEDFEVNDSNMDDDSIGITLSYYSTFTHVDPESSDLEDPDPSSQYFREKNSVKG